MARIVVVYDGKVRGVCVCGISYVGLTWTPFHFFTKVQLSSLTVPTHTHSLALFFSLSLLVAPLCIPLYASSSSFCPKSTMGETYTGL
jgi:hypothetical protein